jgi:heme/copper-type cytochrome/quinol oxidase subunit 4
MTSVLIFLTALALGLITAGIAQWKGRSASTWLLYGLVVSVVAIPFLLTLERRQSDAARLALVYFVAAVLLLAIIAVLVIYRAQNAGAF